MTRYVAFLRAINVGGHIVKMHELRALCESVPLANVSTFIASGNVIFESRKPAAQVEAAIERKLKSALGYEVATMVRSTSDLAGVVEHVASRKLGPGGGVTLYVGFLKTAPAKETLRAVAALSNDVDVLAIEGRELYWRCNKSFAESTVAGPRLGKILNGPVTVRNFNTVQRLALRTAATIA
ncbi:MAG TPA: DUF1697 domain-containing protein [Vicinamibacterales bacterium]|nr:DUF1697 domain-containing protein [Vicinamibacterales bacterium]